MDIGVKSNQGAFLSQGAKRLGGVHDIAT